MNPRLLALAAGMIWHVKRNGGGLSVTKRRRIQYGALLMLTVGAFGLSGLALMNQRGTSSAVDNVAAFSPSALPTAIASLTPTPAVTATPTPQQLKLRLPGDPVLLILGDSYTAGVGADQADQGWAYQVASSLGYPTNIDGVPGTGFAWGGGAQDNMAREYKVRLQEIAEDPRFIPNILILQGGQKDSLISSPDEIQTATTQTIEAARKFWPDVQVVVLGLLAPQPVDEEFRAANGAARAGAADAKAPFIDAHEAGWFTDANSPGYNFDGAHVNTAGHAHIAEKFLESWGAIIQ
jgi:acyl-CoA thioesterase I